jgi:hypothetical protein
MLHLRVKLRVLLCSALETPLIRSGCVSELKNFPLIMSGKSKVANTQS